MKVFFAATYTNDGQYAELFKKIYTTLEELGCTHVDNEVVSMTDQEFMKQMQTGRDAHIEYYKRKMASIQKADICIFEATVPTLAIGYATEKAVEYNKPTIILYFQDNTPFFLAGAGAEDDKLVVKSYTEKNLKKILKDVLNAAKERRDKRFNFFISPRLLSYLDKVSKEQGITKSTFIRNLIVEHIRKSTLSPEPKI